MNAIALTILLQASLAATGDHSYPEAYHAAAESGKPLVVLVGADWCPGCRVMSNRTIPELKRKGKLADVSFAYVNTDRDRALAAKLQRGGSIPQLIMYRKTETGWVRRQMTGAQSSAKVDEFLRRGLKKPPAKSKSDQG